MKNNWDYQIYTSQSNDIETFANDDDKYKFIDDLSLIKIINLIIQGLANFNCRMNLPSDITRGNNFLPPQNSNSQHYMNDLSSWTARKQIKLIVKKNGKHGLSTALKISSSIPNFI